MPLVSALFRIYDGVLLTDSSVSPLLVALQDHQKLPLHFLVEVFPTFLNLRLTKQPPFHVIWLASAHCTRASSILPGVAFLILLPKRSMSKSSTRALLEPSPELPAPVPFLLALSHFSTTNLSLQARLLWASLT